MSIYGLLILRVRQTKTGEGETEVELDLLARFVLSFVGGDEWGGRCDRFGKKKKKKKPTVISHFQIFDYYWICFKI